MSRSGKDIDQGQREAAGLGEGVTWDQGTEPGLRAPAQFKARVWKAPREHLLFSSPSTPASPGGLLKMPVAGHTSRRPPGRLSPDTDPTLLL